MCHRSFHQICLLEPIKDKIIKTALNEFIRLVTESKHKPIRYGLIKEKDFRIALSKNQCTIYIKVISFLEVDKNFEE